MPWSVVSGGMVVWVAVTVGCTGKTEESPAARTPDNMATVGDTSAAQPGLRSDVVSTSTSAAIPAGTPFWPRFHGPKGDNLSSDTGLLKEWPKSGPPLLWTAKGLGHGYASVTLANGLIYTAGNIDEKTVVTALDLDGKLRWQADNGPAWTRDYPGTRGTPTIDGDRVYHESPLGELTCYDAKSGQKIWSVNILKQFDGQNITWALAESVLIDGDRLICCPGGDKASVAALDKKTGKTVWTTPSTGVKTSYASPVLVEDQGLRMILTMNSKAFLAVNADTGELLCTFPHQTSYDVNATSPIYREGHVFLCSGYGTGSVLLKLTVNGKKASVEQVWKNKDLDNHHGGVIFLDGYLYGAAYRGNWVCLEWKTGKRMYSERGVGKGSLTFADGMLYTLSEQRDLGLVEATPKAHKVISKFKIPSGGEGPSWAHPVVCGGRLYVRHSDQLYAYDVRAGQ
jgi:outer membrane protein assembly factor BamB